MSGILKLRQKLTEQLTIAAAKAQQTGKLPTVALPEVSLEHPQHSKHGDYASSFPLKLARATGIKPLTIAAEITSLMTPGPEVESIVTAPPGFINFTLKNSWLTSQIETILPAGETYGNIDLGQARRMQVEFVSVNPTGPLHVGHGRGAIFGSTLANVLTASAYNVEKEYYVNDAGNQIDVFYRSLYTRYQQCLGTKTEMPVNGYLGDYVTDLAKEIIAEKGDRYLNLPETEVISQLGQLGLDKMITQIKADLELLGVTFDVWFSESSLHGKGQFQTAMSLLHQGGYLAEKEGATWFMSTALGEDKDNVVIRGNGSPTYFATDIAYHYNKFVERKFEKVINIWGADHQGHVPRMKAVVNALGISPERLKVIISQMVTLHRGEQLVRVSKRSGDLITLREVIEEVGTDACRFFFLSRTADSQMDFDLELAKKESADNPVYYVQYAHARIASILRLAEERRIDFGNGDVSLLTHEPELTLIRKLMLLPELVETVATTLEPHHLTYYAQDLATVFHSFYRDCRVISPNKTLTKARLKLVKATKIVLAKTLHLLGMTTPESM
ncbi:MAG: arginine--tRNA ligase [Dehalococcoidales bacterium]|jgi:arginyl-tRNA synthetase|nr:arginine--tRNA ligase [Dehalococcoidales bacterium]MDP6737819.1 arginine--tRNA ligase [Dehalococcoidales bacterium]